MFKITVLSLFTLITFSCPAMQQSLRPWVQAAKEISVITVEQTIAVPINNNATVADVKVFLRDKPQGIPIYQQTLYVLKDGWETFDASHASRLEDDSKNIKEIMNKKNSKLFALYRSACSSCRLKPGV